MDQVGDEVGLEGEVALSEADAQAEGDDGLVENDGDGDAQHLVALLLEPDGHALEDSVEGEGEEKHQRSERRMPGHLGHMAVVGGGDVVLHFVLVQKWLLLHGGVVALVATSAPLV